MLSTEDSNVAQMINVVTTLRVTRFNAAFLLKTANILLFVLTCFLLLLIKSCLLDFVYNLSNRWQHINGQFIWYLLYDMIDLSSNGYWDFSVICSDFKFSLVYWGKRINNWYIFLCILTSNFGLSCTFKLLLCLESSSWFKFHSCF